MPGNLESRFRALFRRRSIEADMDEELRAHIRSRAADLQRAGLGRAEAERRARIEFGGYERIKEECREARGGQLTEALAQDLRFGLRQLRKSPGFTAIAVLTLALGIGSNTAVFSMVNALLLHPYPFANLDRLVKVWEDRGVDEGYDARFMAPADASDLRATSAALADSTSYRCGDLNLTVHGDTQQALGCHASANFFDVIGAAPALGRAFRPGEDLPGRDQVAILSHGFWERHFGGNPAALGQTIQIDGRSYTVVGVMPEKFDYPLPMELWVPLALGHQELADRSRLSLQVLGRLKPGVSAEAARASLGALSERLAREYPKTNAARRITLLPLRQELYLYTLPLFLLLQVAAACVLALACANLTNLLFARLIGRQKEIAVRVALGAGRRRLARLFLIETTLFSLLAAGVAAAASMWAAGLLRASISPDWTRWVPGWDGIRVDGTVLAVAILLGAAVGIFFGLAAAIRGGGVEVSQTLKEAGPGSMTRSRGALRNGLVVAQVTLALVLLVCAGLMIQGFGRLGRVYGNLRPERVFRAEISLPARSYGSSAKITEFFRSVVRQAAALPGVTSAALVTNTPASNVDNRRTFFTIEGRPAPRPNQTPSADLQIASPRYFETLGVPLLAGRDFSEADTAAGAPVAVISGSLASVYWPGRDAVGQRVRLGGADSAAAWMTVVGVAGEVRQNWWDPPARPTIYETFTQAPVRGMTLVARSGSDPAGYGPAVREIVRRIDSGIAAPSGDTLEKEVTDSIGIIRILGALMGAFGLVALTLATVGVYAVISDSIAQRRHEIGIRVALGARPADVVGLVVRRSLKLTALGIAIALPIAYGASRAMANLVFGITEMNAPLVAGFAALLGVAALAACVAPARRALRTAPMAALRNE